MAKSVLRVKQVKVPSSGLLPTLTNKCKSDGKLISLTNTVSLLLNLIEKKYAGYI